ncbi:hypothetical protein AAMO2058_000241500 [Amorphochlora amoebiformis]
MMHVLGLLLASLATAEPIPVNHVPAFDDMKPDLNSSEEAVMGGDIAEIAVPGIVLEISGSPGMLLPDPMMIPSLVDAMIAPLFSENLPGTSDPFSPSSFLPSMNLPFGPFSHGNPRHTPHRPRKHMHSKLARHPHFGLCNEDKERLCANVAKNAANHHGLSNLLEAMACMAENHRRVSSQCAKTLTMTTIPGCLDDIKEHCIKHDSLHSCMDSDHKKFSQTCLKHLHNATSNEAVVPIKEAPAIPEAVLTKNDKKSAAPVFKLNDSVGAMHSKDMNRMLHTTFIVQAAGALLGTIVIAGVLYYFCVCTTPMQKFKAKRKATAIRYGKIQCKVVNDQDL